MSDADQLVPRYRPAAIRRYPVEEQSGVQDAAALPADLDRAAVALPADLDLDRPAHREEVGSGSDAQDAAVGRVRFVGAERE